MLKLSHRAQSILEYLIMISIAAGAVVIAFRYIRFAVEQKIQEVGAER